jgi:long-subunit fatty acid transport protein
MQKNFFSKWLIALTALMFIFAFAVAAFGKDPATTQYQPKSGKMSKKMEAPKGLLDGKYFVGQIGPEGKATGDKEAISFTHGIFHSAACDPNGFVPAAYTATKEGDLIRFTVTCTSPTNGTMEWSGTVKGKELDASAKMTEEGKEPMTMWAKGTASKMERAEHKSGKMSKNSGESKKVGG